MLIWLVRQRQVRCVVFVSATVQHLGVVIFVSFVDVLVAEAAPYGQCVTNSDYCEFSNYSSLYLLTVLSSPFPNCSSLEYTNGTSRPAAS